MRNTLLFVNLPDIASLKVECPAFYLLGPTCLRRVGVWGEPCDNEWNGPARDASRLSFGNADVRKSHVEITGSNRTLRKQRGSCGE